MVTVPSVEHEQLRDLVRCREDIRGDLMRARHRLGKFLLRREIYYEGPHTAWSRRHRAWLASLKFADRASQLTIADYLHAHDVLLARRDRIEAELEQLAADSPWTVTIARLRCLRGIDTLSALGLCAEVGAVRPLRASRPAVRLSRDRPLGEHHRPAAPTGRDHQGRLHPRPPAVGRGRLPLPAPPRRSARRSSVASVTSQPRSSTSPGARNGGCTPAGASSSTPAASATGSSRSRSPASSPASAGRSPPGSAATEPFTANQPVLGCRDGAAPPYSRTTSPRVACEQPARQRAALDLRRRTVRRTKVLGNSPRI